MALATVDDYKLRTGVSGTDSDAEITAAIADVTNEIQVYLDRELESATVTDEQGAGLGAAYLTVRRFPVTSVTSISVRTDDSTYTPLAATAYEIRGDGSEGIVDIVDSGGLWVVSDCWPRGGFGGRRGGPRTNSYKITYVGGYLSGTHDTQLGALKSLVCDMASKLAVPTNPATRADMQVYQSENIGYQSWTFRPASEVIDQFASRLDRFRRVGL